RAWLAKQHLWRGDLADARTLFEAVLADDARAGTDLERRDRRGDLGLPECAAGNLELAADLVRKGIEAARGADNVDAGGWLLFLLGLRCAWLGAAGCAPRGGADAWRGRAVDARAAADRLLEWATARSARPWIVRARSVLGLLALSED